MVNFWNDNFDFQKAHESESIIIPTKGHDSVPLVTLHHVWNLVLASISISHPDRFIGVIPVSRIIIFQENLSIYNQEPCEETVKRSYASLEFILKPRAVYHMPLIGDKDWIPEEFYFNDSLINIYTGSHNGNLP